MNVYFRVTFTGGAGAGAWFAVGVSSQQVSRTGSAGIKPWLLYRHTAACIWLLLCCQGMIGGDVVVVVPGEFKVGLCMPI